MAKKKAARAPARRAAKLKPGQPVPADVKAFFEQHERYLAAGRANYAKADKAVKELLKRCEPGCYVITEGTRRKNPERIELVDQFAETNQVWAGSSCKRFKIQSTEIKPQD